MKPTTAGLLLLATLAIASAWWLASIGREPAPREPAQGPDWYFADARFSSTDATGTIHYRLDAGHVEHIPAGDRGARMDDVRMEWRQALERPLDIRSAHATVSPDGSRIRLDGGVRILDQAPGVPMELLTDTLHIDANGHHAHTDGEVVVLTTDGRLVACGMDADARTGVIRLLSDVRGRYAE